MFGIGVQELALLFVVALLIFGPKRLPELARTLGKGMAEFRRASADLRQTLSLDEQPQRREAPVHREPADDPRQSRDLAHAPPQTIGDPAAVPVAPLEAKTSDEFRVPDEDTAHHDTAHHARPEGEGEPNDSHEREANADGGDPPEAQPRKPGEPPAD